MFMFRWFKEASNTDCYSSTCTLKSYWLNDEVHFTMISVPSKSWKFRSETRHMNLVIQVSLACFVIPILKV